MTTFWLQISRQLSSSFLFPPLSFSLLLSLSLPLSPLKDLPAKYPSAYPEPVHCPAAERDPRFPNNILRLEQKPKMRERRNCRKVTAKSGSIAEGCALQIRTVEHPFLSFICLTFLLFFTVASRRSAPCSPRPVDLCP